MEKITHVTLMVADQQAALDWYTEKLGWKVVADMPFPGGMPGRWVTVAPSAQGDLEVVLQPPEWGSEGDESSRKAWIGQGPGFVVTTNDCRAEVQRLRDSGVQIYSEPEEMPWGISANFVDLNGYVHNLLQPAVE